VFKVQYPLPQDSEQPIDVLSSTRSTNAVPEEKETKTETKVDEKSGTPAVGEDEIDEVTGSGMNIELPKGILKWVKGYRFDSEADMEMIKRVSMKWIRLPFYVEEDNATQDASWVPPPKLYHLYPRPRARRARPPIKGFFLVQRVERIVQAIVEEVEEEETKKTKGKKEKKQEKRRNSFTTPSPALVEPPRTEIVYEPLNKARWHLSANSECVLIFQFCSTETGNFSFNMDFEIQDSAPHISPVSCQLRGVCAAPEIARDPRSVFMRRTKLRKPGLSRAWVQSEGVFEFGALLKGRNPDSRFVGGTPPTQVLTLEEPAKEKEQPTKENKEPPRVGPDGIEEPIPVTVPVVISPQEAKKQRQLQKFLRKTYATVFRISNVAPFPVHCDFALRDAVNSIKPDIQTQEQPGRKESSHKPKSKSKAKEKVSKKSKKDAGKLKSKSKDTEKIAMEEEELKRLEELRSRLVYSIEPETLE
jgi:hypothetical protein